MGWGSSPHGNPHGVSGPTDDAHGGVSSGFGIGGVTGPGNMSHMSPDTWGTQIGGPRHGMPVSGYSMTDQTRAGLSGPEAAALGRDGVSTAADISGMLPGFDDVDPDSFSLESEMKAQELIGQIEDKSKKTTSRNVLATALGMFATIMGLPVGPPVAGMIGRNVRGVVSQARDAREIGKLAETSHVARGYMDDMAARQDALARQPGPEAEGVPYLPVSQAQYVEPSQPKAGLGIDIDGYREQSQLALDKGFAQHDQGSLADKARARIEEKQDREKIMNMARQYVLRAIS